MLVFLLIASMFGQGLTVLSYGNNFITAFPENLGFFHPAYHLTSLNVMALYNNTTFKVFYSGIEKEIIIPNSGQTVNVNIAPSAEVNLFSSSDKSVRITSDKNITVYSVSKREASTQINVVQPTVNLGKNYMIPQLDYLNYLDSFNLNKPGSTAMRYSSFKLLIINAVASTNTITVVKKTASDDQEDEFKIDSYKLFQFQTNSSVVRVESDKEVAVILTHPCVEVEDCGCNMVINQILPTEFQDKNFIVPSIFNVAMTRLLLTSEQSTSLIRKGSTLATSSALLPFPDLLTSELVTASERVSLRLVSPGLIVELIPLSMFSACYLLQFSDNNGQAVVIAETDSKGDVRTHTGLPLASVWTAITGTNYSSTVVTIPNRTATIWHPTSKIAVYMLQNMSMTVLFGGPAMPISEKPDLHGCALVPGAYSVGADPLSWKQSREYCMNNGKQFACPVSKTVLKDMADNLTKNDGHGWIGLRRSLLTTDWYWQEEYDTPTDVTYVHWDDKQPLNPLKGLCTSVSLDHKNDFKWHSARCCDQKKPVCYKRPEYFNPLPFWIPQSFP